MWQSFPALQNRIVSILGEDVAATQLITRIQIFPNQVMVEIFERYDEAPKNLKAKNKDCIRFDLSFQPTSVTVSETKLQGMPLSPLKLIDETTVEFEMGKFSYRFSSKKINFYGFQTLVYAKVVDNNFGRTVD